MWFELPKPVIIAHRGDSVHTPENTLAAFQSASRLGAEAIEFDVKLTLDGHVIVIHDQTVGRTTNGRGRVSQLTLSELRDLDAGSYFSNQFRGERIPTLEETFETVGQHLLMNIELTNYDTPRDALVLKVVEMIEKHGLQNRVLLSSFFARNLRKAKKLMPAVPCGILAWSGWMGSWVRTVGWQDVWDALHPHLNNVDDRLVGHVHAAGKRINVWTVNYDKDLHRMIGYGVDGIITDNPGLVARLLGRMQ